MILKSKLNAISKNFVNPMANKQQIEAVIAKKKEENSKNE